MINNKSTGNPERKAIIIFLLIAFIPAWVLFAVPAVLEFTGSKAETARMVGLACWSLAMWMPGLGAILATRKGEDKIVPALGLNRLGKKRIYLWAWLTPIFLSIAAGLVAWLLGWGEIDTSFRLIKESLESLPDNTEISLPLIVGLQIGASLTLGPLFNSLFALGEELGWRGYLLPKLMDQGMGQLRAITVSGLIWGFWHAPAILQGLNYPENPVLGVGMMMVFTSLLGIFFSWLYLKTKSPWAPALGHGSLNASASLPLLFLETTNLTLAGALTSISGWIVLAVLAGYLVLRGEIQIIKNSDVSRETLSL